MDIILNIILPVFGSLGLGYLAARLGLFDEAANRGLSLFVFNFAIPLMLFEAIARAELPHQMPWGFLLSYYLGAAAAFACAMLACRGLFGRRLDEQGVLGLGAGFSNTGMLGIPLVMTAYGPPAALPLFVIIACHSLFLLPPATALIEAGRGGQEGWTRMLLTLGRRTAATPVIWGLSAGLAVSLLGLSVPAPIQAVAKSLGAAASPCALFALGASLTRYRITGNLREPLILVTAKALVHPLVVWLLASQVFGLPALWTMVGTTLAALPTGVTPYLFAQRYQLCVATSAAAIFISTMVSIASLSVLLVVFKGAP